MKRILGICLVAVAAAFSVSCNKEKLTEFDIPYSTTVPVPAGSYTANVPADFTSPNIPTQSASKFSAEKTAADHISEIKLTRFNVSVSQGNLNALKSMSVYLKTSGMNDVLVATKSNIPAGATSVAADLQDVNIKDYILKDNIQFRVTVTMGPDSLAGGELKMDQTVHVKAKLLK